MGIILIISAKVCHKVKNNNTQVLCIVVVTEIIHFNLMINLFVSLNKLIYVIKGSIIEVADGNHLD